MLIVLTTFKYMQMTFITKRIVQNTINICFVKVNGLWTWYSIVILSFIKTIDLIYQGMNEFALIS